MPPSLGKAALASRRRCYHGVVRSVPHRGTVNTTPWYCDYHTVVLSVPRRGTASTKPFWFFGTVKWGLTPNRFAGAAPAMHPTWPVRTPHGPSAFFYISSIGNAYAKSFREKVAEVTGEDAEEEK